MVVQGDPEKEGPAFDSLHFLQNFNETLVITNLLLSKHHIKT